MTLKNEANTILISMVRYIHSKYDHEINSNSNTLTALLKKAVDKHDDKILHEYWNDYLTLTALPKRQETTSDSLDIENVEESKEAMESQATENSEENTIPNSLNDTSRSSDIAGEPNLSFGRSIKKRINQYKQERKERGK